MIEKFQQYIENHGLINRDERVLLALSGGVDSMVLAELLLRSGYNIACAHCNFHLRGDDSDEDERFVRNYCENNGVDIFVKQFDTLEYARIKKISIEMAARELRYHWFGQLLENDGFDKLAIAHHADDQIETFFINLLRGSGIKGLKAMQPVNGLHIRPLLWASRDEIKRFAIENDIKWREDFTNQETLYLRNKIRHELLPALDGVKINAREKIRQSIEFLASENQLYRELINEKIAEIENVDDKLLSVKKCDLGNSTQLLFEWVRNLGFSYSQCEAVMSVLHSETGKEFYSSDYQLVVEKDTIEVFPIHLCLPKKNIVVDVYKREPDFTIEKNNKDVAQLDGMKLKMPLKLRLWQNGDRFQPLGMRGSKLVSDFYNDMGFTTFQKRTTWIVVDNEDNIVWIAGCRIDDRFKITEKTTVISEIYLD